MPSTLNQILASAHRDELRRQAVQHGRARQSLRHRAWRKTPVNARIRVPYLRITGRRSEGMRPAAAA